MSDKNKMQFKVQNVSWAKPSCRKSFLYPRKRFPWIDPGTGVEIAVAGLLALAMITLILWAIRNTCPWSDTFPELVDLHRQDDYRETTINAGALAADGSRLFVGHDGGGLTIIDPKLFSIAREQSGEINGPSSDYLLDLATGPDGSVLAMTKDSGRGVDLRKPDGSWQTLIPATGIPNLTHQDILHVTGSDRLLIMVLRDGRLICYDRKNRFLHEMDVDGRIPGTVVSATLVKSAEEQDISLWLVEDQHLIHVQGRLLERLSAVRVTVPDGQKPKELAASDIGLFVRMEKGALYLNQGTWRLLLGGEQWPGLEFKDIRFAGMSADASTLWIIPSASMESPYNVGAYIFDEHRWACGTLDDDELHRNHGDFALVSPDGHHLLVPRASSGFTMLERSGDHIKTRHVNSLGQEGIVCASADDRYVVLTLHASSPQRRIVRLISWNDVIMSEKATGELIRVAQACDLEDHQVIEIVPVRDKLFFLDDVGRVFPYDLRLRGFGRPGQLKTPEDHSPSRLLSAAFDGNALYVLNEHMAILSYDPNMLGTKEEIAGHPVYIPEQFPADIPVVHALALEGGFDLLLEDGTAWHYSFRSGWSKVAENLVANDMIRLPDQRICTRSMNGELVVRRSGAWMPVAPAVKDMTLMALMPCGDEPIVKIGSGAWGRMLYRPQDSVWAFEPLFPAPPEGKNSLSLPITAVAATMDESGLILGDTSGLIHYHFADRIWNRLFASEQGSWIFTQFHQDIFALNQTSGFLYRVSIESDFDHSVYPDAFIAVAASDNHVLGLRRDGSLEGLAGDWPEHLSLSTMPDAGLTDNGPFISGAALGREIGVVCINGNLFRYAFQEGCVFRVDGPWSNPLVKIRAGTDFVGVLDSKGNVFTAGQIAGPYQKYNSLEEIDIVDIADLKTGLVAYNRQGGMEYLRTPKEVRMLAGGRRPDRSCGDLATVLIEEDRITLGGSEGLAVRSPHTLCLTARQDQHIGSVRRFEQVGDYVFAWTEQGLFQRDENGIFRKAGGTDLVGLTELTIQDQNYIVAFDGNGRVWHLVIGSEPKALNLFGGETVEARSITQALDLKDNRILLALKGGGLQVYFQHQRRLVTVQQPQPSDIVYLGRVDSNRVCILREGGMYQLFHLTPQGTLGRVIQERDDIHDWILIDGEAWDNPVNNLILLTHRHEILHFETDGLAAATLKSANWSPASNPIRILPIGSDLLILDQGRIYRHSPTTMRNKLERQNIEDIWPLGNGGYVYMSSDRVMHSSSDRYDDVKRVRGDGTAVAFESKMSHGVSIWRERSNEQFDLSKSLEISSGITSLWSDADEDLLWVLDTHGRLYKYDARRATWTKLREADTDYTAIVGSGQQPVLLYGKGKVLELSTGTAARTLTIPVVSENGRVAYVDADRYGLHEVDMRGSKELFRPEPVCGKQQSYQWAVQIEGTKGLSGGVMIGLSNEILWFQENIQHPVQVEKPQQHIYPLTQWLQTPEESNTVWGWNDQGQLVQVVPGKIHLVGTQVKQVLGVFQGYGLWLDNEDRLIAAVPGAQPKMLLSRIPEKVPLAGTAFSLGPGQGSAAIDSDGRLLFRRTCLPGGSWQPISSEWKLIEGITVSDDGYVIRGIDTSSRLRFATVRVEKENIKLIQDVKVWTTFVHDAISDRPIGIFPIKSETLQWIQDPATGELLFVDATKAEFHGRLSLKRNAFVERDSAIERYKIGDSGQLWVCINENWLTYKAYLRGGTAPAENSVLPDTTLLKLMPMAEPEYGYDAFFEDGTKRVLSGGRFYDDSVIEKICDRSTAYELCVIEGRVALIDQQTGTILFEIRPGQAWPGSQGFREVIFCHGEFYAIENGWPSPRPLDPTDVPGAVQVDKGIWRVPLAGWKDVLVSQHPAGHWEELSSSHAFMQRIGLSPKTSYSSDFLTYKDAEAMINATIQVDPKGLYIELPSNRGLLWHGDKWIPMKVHPAQEIPDRYPIAKDGTLSVDRWSSVSLCEQGVLIQTERHQWLMPLAAQDKLFISSINEMVMPRQIDAIKLRQSLTSSKLSFSDERLILDGSKLSFGLDLQTGFLDCDVIMDVTLAFDSLSWLVKTRDGIIRQIVQGQLQNVSQVWIPVAAPKSFTLGNRFTQADKVLYWQPEELKNAIRLGGMDEVDVFETDTIVDFLPAAEQGLYHLSHSGLWLWQGQTRRAVADDAGFAVNGKSLELARPENESPIRVVVGSGQIFSLTKAAASSIMRPTKTFHHPLSGTGSQAYLAWTSDDNSRVRFAVEVRTADRYVSQEVTFHEQGFDYAFPEELTLREGRVWAQSRSGIAFDLNLFDRLNERPFHSRQPIIKPDSPSVVGLQQSVEFRRDPAGFWNPWILTYDGRRVPSERSDNGQFSHDRLRWMASAGQKAALWTPKGLLETSTDIKEIRLLPDVPADKSFKAMYISDAIYLWLDSGLFMWNDSQWQATSILNSPFASHLMYASVTRSDRWRSIPAAPPRNFELEYHFGCGTWHRVTFDAQRGVFSMDASNLQNIDDAVRSTPTGVQWHTQQGWLHQDTLSHQTAEPGKILRQDPASGPDPTVRTADGRLEVHRDGGQHTLTIHNVIQEAQLAGLDVPWDIKEGRLAHDRITGISAVPHEDVFVLAAQAGLREWRLNGESVKTVMVPLDENPPQIVSSLYADSQNVTVKDASGKTFLRSDGLWKTCENESYDEIRRRFMQRKGMLKQARLHWQAVEESTDTQFILQPEQGEIIPLNLDRLGFEQDRPHWIVQKQGLWYSAGEAFYYLQNSGQGILGLVKEGAAPVAVRQSRSKSFEPFTVIQRNDLAYTLDLDTLSWTKAVDVHPNLWSSFMEPELLIEALDQGQIRVDWQPPAIEDQIPSRVQLLSDKGRFEHDRMNDIAFFKKHGHCYMLSSSPAGLAIRNLAEQNLLDIKKPDDSLLKRLIPSEEGIIAKSNKSLYRVQLDPLLHFEHVNTAIGASIYRGPVLDISYTILSDQRIRIASVMADGTLQSDLGLKNGHLPGDLVGAAFIDQQGLWLFTDDGMLRYTDQDSGYRQPTTGLMRPEDPSWSSIFGVQPLIPVPSDQRIHGQKIRDTLWLVFRKNNDTRILRFKDTDDWGPDTPEHFSSASAAEHRRDGWNWRHTGFGHPLSLKMDAMRDGKTVQIQVKTYQGGLDVDHCHGLANVAGQILVAGPLGLRVPDTEAPGQLFLPNHDLVFQEPPRFGRNDAGLLCAAIPRTQQVLVLDKSRNRLILDPDPQAFGRMKTAEFVDADCKVYRDSHNSLHMVLKDRELHLRDDRIFVEGQFSFDRVAFLIGENQRAVTITHAGIEGLNEAGRLSHLFNLSQSPAHVGLHDGCLTIDFILSKNILQNGSLVPFDGDVTRPDQHSEYKVRHHTLNYHNGELIIDGLIITLPGESIAAFSAGGRLWLLEDNTIRWVRLDERWLKRMVREQPEP